MTNGPRVRSGGSTWAVPACIDIVEDAEDADGVTETGGGSSPALVRDVGAGRVREQLVWFTIGIIEITCLYAWISIMHVPDNFWMVESKSTMMLDLEKRECPCADADEADG